MLFEKYEKYYSSLVSLGTIIRKLGFFPFSSELFSKITGVNAFIISCLLIDRGPTVLLWENSIFFRF